MKSWMWVCPEELRSVSVAGWLAGLVFCSYPSRTRGTSRRNVPSICDECVRGGGGGGRGEGEVLLLVKGNMKCTQ